MQFKKLFGTISGGAKLFLGAYILYNLQSFLLDSLYSMKASRYSDASEYDKNTRENGMDLSNEIKQFLEISNNTTHCLENYVGDQFVSKESMKPNPADCVTFNKQPKIKAGISFDEEIDIRKKRIKIYSSKLFHHQGNSRYDEPSENSRASQKFCEGKNFQFLNSPLKQCSFSPIPQTDAIDLISPLTASFPSVISPVDLNLCSQFELNGNQLKPVHDWNIPQLDGLDDVPFNGLAGINCDDQFISSVITIFRSFEGVWKEFDDHQLCMRAKPKTGLRCLFCQVRSLSLRMNRAKIRVNIKPVEITSQQDQLPNKAILQNNFANHFHQVLEKLELCEEKLKKANFGKNLICQNCSQNVEVCSHWTIHATKQNLSQLSRPSVKTILSKLLSDAARKHDCSMYSRENILQTNGLEKFIVMTFETPNKIIVPDEFSYQERKFSFISQIYENEDKTMKSSFKYQNEIYSTLDMKIPTKIDHIWQENISLVVYKLKSGQDDVWQIADSPIVYKQNSLENMSRRLMSLVAPEKYQKRKHDQQDADKRREKTPKRKEDHKNIDKKRNETPKRKEKLKVMDTKRRKTEKRKEYIKDYNMKKFIKSIHTDTGFNIICTSCAEFKSRYLCVKATVLTDTQQNKHLTSLIESKDGKIYICKICRSQIAA